MTTITVKKSIINRFLGLKRCIWSTGLSHSSTLVKVHFQNCQYKKKFLKWINKEES